MTQCKRSPTERHAAGLGSQPMWRRRSTAGSRDIAARLRLARELDVYAIAVGGGPASPAAWKGVHIAGRRRSCRRLTSLFQRRVALIAHESRRAIVLVRQTVGRPARGERASAQQVDAPPHRIHVTVGVDDVLAPLVRAPAAWPPMILGRHCVLIRVDVRARSPLPHTQSHVDAAYTNSTPSTTARGVPNRRMIETSSSLLHAIASSQALRLRPCRIAEGLALIAVVWKSIDRAAVRRASPLD